MVSISVFMLLSSVSFCVASGSVQSRHEAPSITITKDQNGRQVAVPKGTRILMELPFLGSAGYGWHIEKVDGNLLQFLQEETKPIDSTGRIGGPVLGVWHFLAVRQGTASIEMKYYRIWEGPDTASDHFVVEIKVE